MTKLPVIVLGVLGAIGGWSLPAVAQTADPAGRVDVGIGFLWIGRQPLGMLTATETTASGGTLPLFTGSRELAAAAGLEGRVGVRLMTSLFVDAETSYLKPQLRIALSGDAEGAAPLTAAETTEQLTVGASVRWYVPGRIWSSRFAPFVTAGGGYLRQLHEKATAVEAGRFYQVGGGVSARLFQGGRFHTKGVGARADVRALIRSKGVAFDAASKTSPAAGLSAFVRF